MGLFDLFAKKRPEPRPAPRYTSPASIPAGAPAADLYSYRGSPSDYFHAILSNCFREYEIQQNVTAIAGKSAPSVSSKVWFCSCGTENQGSFCFNCGEKRPVPPPSGSWTCGCGSENTGKFCPECGAAKPESNEWTCTCGTVNMGKFCPECGSAKPAAASAASSLTLAYDGDVPVDFLLLKNGQPRLAILLCPKSKYNNKPFRNTIANCDAIGIPCLRFMQEFRNDANYVVDRINSVLR